MNSASSEQHSPQPLEPITQRAEIPIVTADIPDILNPSANMITRVITDADRLLALKRGLVRGAQNLHTTPGQRSTFAN